MDIQMTETEQEGKPRCEIKRGDVVTDEMLNAIASDRVALTMERRVMMLEAGMVLTPAMLEEIAKGRTFGFGGKFYHAWAEQPQAATDRVKYRVVRKEV
jgi:hypothetical protein